MSRFSTYYKSIWCFLFFYSFISILFQFLYILALFIYLRLCSFTVFHYLIHLLMYLRYYAQGHSEVFFYVFILYIFHISTVLFPLISSFFSFFFNIVKMVFASWAFLILFPFLFSLFCVFPLPMFAFPSCHPRRSFTLSSFTKISSTLLTQSFQEAFNGDTIFFFL